MAFPADRAFALANVAVLPFWALMIFAPGWSVTRRVMASPLSVAWLPLAYVALLAPELGKVLPLFANPKGPPSLAVVRDLLATDYGTLVAWVHLLAFDLFVGRWVYLDAHERGLRRWLMAPILFLTLMFGPAGFLAYLLLTSAVAFRLANRT